MTLSTATAIDISRLPPPVIIELLDVSAILTQMRADFLARYPAFDAAVESDPVQKLLEVAAYREWLLRAEFNQRARGCMIAFAEASDLDQLGALLGAQRLEVTPADTYLNIPAVMENDDDFRRRIVLSPEGFSVAGPEGAYISHALAADGDVLDASATSPAPGEVMVTVLSRLADGTASPELLALVNDAVSAEDVRPLTDMVTVQGPDIIEYVVAAEIETFAGPDKDLVLTEARRQLDGYITRSRKLGRDIVRSGHIGALHVEGVSRVRLISPAADQILDRTQAAYCTAITLTHSGTGE
ncbi:baseplate assembly protein [Sphingopyxis yananensis]|uniref:baseplate assembly protein n=1 Tax=Sphingopyxis yananensis TaxID=2886687 RepID=UPI001D1019FC|nr:baseplate J/gp47 family protein [Sphingopyxis yananensis]MCC2602535.1 baseplate J/gp47 family protein [Sphingopyxis yananensis]